MQDNTSTKPALAISPHKLLFNATEAAAACSVSPRHWFALDSAGRVPRPIRLGRCVRWRAEDLENWLAAGAPTRDVWERDQQERM